MTLRPKADIFVDRGVVRLIQRGPGELLNAVLLI